MTASLTKRGWRSGRRGSWHAKPIYDRWRDGYDRTFADTCTARLGNGAWRWGGDPEGEYREPPGPPLGTTKKEWDNEH